MSAQQPILPFPDNSAPGWSADELKALGVTHEPKEEAKPEIKPAESAPPGVSLAEVQSMLHQQQAYTNQQNQLLMQQLLETNKPKTQESAPSEIPIRLNKDGTPVISTQDLFPLMDNKISAGLDGYHKQVIEPFVPAVEEQVRDQKIKNTVDFLKQKHSDVLDGNDANQVAKTVMAFYESSANPYQNDDIQRTNYAVETARALFKSSGNPSLKQVVSNQVGRTESGSTQQHPYAPGDKITIFRTTANEMGFDNFQASIAAEADLHDYNAKNKMGWNIVVKRPE